MVIRMSKRDEIIQSGIAKNYKVSRINQELKEKGLQEYNPLTYLPNYLNLPKEAWQDLSKELAEGLTTAGSTFVRGLYDVTTPIYKAPQDKKMEAVKKAFQKAVLENDSLKRLGAGTAIGATAGSFIPGVGTVGGGLTGGMLGLLGPKDFTNALLSTYNTRVEDLPSINLQDGKVQFNKGNIDPRDIAQGIFQNPLWASMDIAGIGGIGKKAGQAGKELTSKIGSLQQLLPGSKLADFNREITNSKQWSRTQNADLYQGYNALAKKPLAKRQEIVKNIVSNTGELNEKDLAIANAIKKDLQTAEQARINLGILEPEYSKQNTIAQYVMDNIRDESNLLHKDIMDIIQNKPLRETALKMFNESPLADRVLNLIQEGEDLYKNKDISFLTQKLASTQDPLGEVIARHLNLETPASSDYARIIGRATPEQLANVLDDSIKMQLDRASHVREGLDVFKDMIDSKNLGLNLTKAERSKYINAFRDSLKLDEQLGLQPDLGRALDNSAVDLLLPKGKQNPFYKAMKGGLEFEQGDSIINRFSSDWKKNVLGNPVWVAGNRLGNWSLNSIEGVNLKDYADINKYKKYIPETLRQQTSYNSYINKGSEVLSKAKDKSFGNVMAESINDIKRSIGRFKNSEKTGADLAKLSGELYNRTSNITANPFFALESELEFTDRAANFIRQAKREAKATGKSVEDILKQTKTDKDLFFKLNNQVNKSLGDYIGRNYSQPRLIREGLRLGVPFGKFFTQTLRTTLHGMANQPGTFATNITIPARAGYQRSEWYKDNYDINPEWYEGGVPYKSGKSTRVMSLQPSPIGIIGGRLRSPEELFAMTTPLFTMPYQIAKYSKFGRPATSPRRTWSELHPMDAIKKGINPLDYKPTPEERTKFAINEILQNTYNPYMQATRYVPGLIGLATGEGMGNLYNTMEGVRYKIDKKGRRRYKVKEEPYAYRNIDSPELITLEDPTSYRKQSPIELVGNLFGVSTQKTYKPQITKSTINKLRNKQRSTLQKIEENK